MIYYDSILQFTSERSQLELEKSKLEIQKLAIGKSAGEFKILAPKDGKLHLSTTFTKGMVIQAGNLLWVWLQRLGLSMKR